MSKRKNENILYHIIQALRQLHQGDPPMVWLTFSKNILEAAFEAVCAVYFIKYIYECIEGNVDFHKLFVMVSIFCVFHIAVHFLSAYNNYMEKISTMKIYRHIFQQIIHRAKKIGINQYENPKFYDNFSRALDEALEQGMGGLFLTAWGVGCIVRSMVAMGILVTVDVMLLVFVIPPLLGSLYFGLKESAEEFAARREETVGKRKMEYAKRVFYEKKYAGELRLYPMAKVLFGLHKEGYLERYEKNQVHHRRIAVYRVIETLLFAGILSFGSYLYITYRLKLGGRSSVAAYVAMVSAVGYIVTCISDALERFSQAGKLCMYMKSIRDFMECPLEENVTNAIMPQGNMGDISFEHVSYHYDGSDQMIMKDLNLKVRQGEHIALVGENGAGKTTLMKLLMGLYPVSQGSILVGGKNISRYEPEAYRDQFGAVFQDFQIFSLPLCENVLMKSPETEEERQTVMEALEKAQFGEVLKKMPEGIDTFLTKEFDENGFVCSGGQAQKIAIARVFAKNPQVVILDEPSSALDPIAEYNMYCNMMEAAKGKTVFFISHRMSSARMADRILFLEHGHIVEQGSHEELMKKNGRYAEMFHLQAQNYQEVNGGGLYA
ncbi:MAG: ABC transporter ATP-binding protein/permease [Lachnospiraceae bacterium]|nr:ABC transporter ATP-binding protein/permease [Lachnospiraceae bacterium]